MQINLKQLDAFRAVMQTGSTNEAASVLNISQPAVSRSIKNLEEQIDFLLFIRENGRLYATAEAEDLYHEVKEFYNGVDHMANVLRNVRLVGGGHLRIVTSMPMGQSFLPEVIQSFRQSHPDVRISVRIVVKREMTKWLESQLFDIALLTLPVEYPASRSRMLARAQGVCILPVGHALSDRKVIEARDLQHEDFLSIVPDTVLRIRVDKAFDTLGIERRGMVIETQSAASICQMVSRGLGTSVIDPFTAAGFEKSAIVIRPFRPVIPYSFGMVLPIHRPPSRLAEEFAEALQTHAEGFFAERDHFFA
ncbi:LysR substrate-binding domain-containing protein [Pseudooceanicola aestuarii]|uniref:LysR substrate-binding domain-containing protein n=1 Tax=Pseudooceanicola aestuarii TaxID=2697319 RepID=UPI0013D505FC|nr:LysR substrate-binding domain-containing protein [Pseudooceanicola aestuarii]